MGGAAHIQSAPRAGAVPDAPVEALLTRADQLARRWAIALILALPLERIGEIPLEAFARHAPSLCVRVLRALQSDGELERVQAIAQSRADDEAPARLLAEVTGARDGSAEVQALEALRGVLWEALLDQLSCSSDDVSRAREVAALADRLAYVCSAALVSSLAQARPEEQQAARGAQVRALSDEALAPSAAAPEALARAPLGDGVVIIDEAQPPSAASLRAPAPAPPAAAPPAAAAPAAASGAGVRRSQEQIGAAPEPAGASSGPSRAPNAAMRRRRPRPLPWDTPLYGDSSQGPGGPA